MSDMINKEAAARICEEMEKDHAETPVGSAGQWLLQAAKRIRALPSSQWRPVSEPTEMTELRRKLEVTRKAIQAAVEWHEDWIGDYGPPSTAAHRIAIDLLQSALDETKV